MEIEREYRYHEDLNIVNEVGTYDMVITYENEETNLKESIVIKDSNSSKSNISTFLCLR